MPRTVMAHQQGASATAIADALCCYDIPASLLQTTRLSPPTVALHRFNCNVLLAQVQERVAELIRTLDTLLMEMHSRGIHWKSFLDKLSVINNTYTAVGHHAQP
jgi:hypothetical protein